MSIRTEDRNWERCSPVKLGRSVGPVPALAFCDYDHRASLSAVPEVVRATFEESKLAGLPPSTQLTGTGAPANTDQLLISSTAQSKQRKDRGLQMLFPREKTKTFPQLQTRGPSLPNPNLGMC